MGDVVDDAVQRIQHAMAERYNATLDAPQRVRLSLETLLVLSASAWVQHRSKEASQHPMAAFPLLASITMPATCASIPVVVDGTCARNVVALDYPMHGVIEVEVGKP